MPHRSFLRFALTLAFGSLTWGPGATAFAEPTEAQRLYEAKCLYCHSGANAERLRLRPDQWRRLVERMRQRAPLLISRRDAQLVVQYFVGERHQVVRPPVLSLARPTPIERPAAPVARPVDPNCCASCCAAQASAKVVEPTGPPEAKPVAGPEPEVVAPLSPQDAEAEERGPALLADRCSKCHTVRRAFMRLTTFESGRATIERMRRKMGSGISADDAALLIRFLRARVGRSDEVE